MSNIYEKSIKEKTRLNLRLLITRMRFLLVNLIKKQSNYSHSFEADGYCFLVRMLCLINLCLSCDCQRLPFTLASIVTMVGTLYVSMVLHSYVLSVVFSFLQVLQSFHSSSSLVSS